MRESRKHAFEQEVAARAEDLQLLADKKLDPYVSDDGVVATPTFVEADFPNGPHDFLSHNRHIQALIAELQEEARTEEGRRVLAAAYKLYRGLNDLREDFPS